MNMTKEICC